MTKKSLYRIETQGSHFSSSSSSSCSSSLSEIKDEIDSVTQYIASLDLQQPSRYLPQTQAVLTTEDNWKITLVNPTAHSLFKRDLLDLHVLEVIDVSYRSLLLDKIVKAREEGNSPILICGSPVAILKAHQLRSSAMKTILHVEERVTELFDYSAAQLVQQPIHLIIPRFDPSHTLFTGYSQRGASFPVIVCGENKGQEVLLRITSIPTLAGLITIRRDGRIEDCSDSTFTKYLFGYTSIKDMPIATFIPQFPQLLSCLERDDLIQQGCILNNTICRSVLSTSSSHPTTPIAVNRKPSTTPTGRPLPILVAIHRDGTCLEIDLQLQPTHHNLISLWITFDRQAILSRYGHTFQYTQSVPKNTTNNNSRSKSINIPTASIQPVTSTSVHKLWPTTLGEYSAQSLKTNIKDYEIVGELGQGTYGIVKLAYLKQDVEKKKVVIKYVYKSRILVDCWTRDKKLGLVPAEIHVLHTLRKIPHANCSDMLDYFEDDDHYYVVMDLFGAGIDLFDYIELKKDGLSESEIRLIFRQVIEAVGHLHDNQIVHRDIKDENVILDLKGGVRLIDFGSATYMKEGRRYDTFVGTLDYAAPEILKGQSYTGPPQDIWACGTLLYTLIYRENPFYNIEEIMEHELRLPFIMSQESVDLVSKMLERDTKVEEIFKDRAYLTENEFLPVTRCCNLSDYLNVTFYRKLVKQKEHLTLSDFVIEWTELYKKDKVSLLFHIIKRSNSSFISPKDFLLILEAVVIHHPGLSFLDDNVMFQERYRQMNLIQFRQSQFHQVIQSLQHDTDLNHIQNCFSYKHFYVLYCKFWAIDQDHDLLVFEHDLMSYNGGILSKKLIHQIMKYGKIPAFSRNGIRKDTLTYLDYIWFFMSEVDKSTTVAIEYWFRCLDEDGDGIITCYDLYHYWKEQEKRNDLIQPKVPSQYRLNDLKKNGFIAEKFFDTFLNFDKFQFHDAYQTLYRANHQLSEKKLTVDSDMFLLEPFTLGTWNEYANQEYQVLLLNEQDDDWSIHPVDMNKTECGNVGDESDTNSMPTTPKLQPDTQDKEIEQQPNWIWYSA
ncbi:hypothetical protein G6F57_006085 [Rhizopus arrhizus]|uniref:non-specific serine/threonine protein kinase n=1 Tax=Rhizopus oryzae TaxID=64495 RepID=A0A9P6XA08_RHIOR|nr:hypothetical protein G6F23_001471 [Rhizopus arrhizus]KAG1415029.1 hypothetical protein G6F58_006675 [Rhizopus delemar]KAG0763784.1 hypothetical protein G6F24_005744 [Rhizopus arrhizus]KAG0796826.1 hypothetical protein G6F21_000988 [Rhizopus arrhizus]KAG0811821.1 hypothetical protein G6F20_006853 [Rhizopus arrhizus]